MPRPNRALVVAAGWLLALAAAAASPADHVVLIVVDGLRPEAIAAAPAPHMLALFRSAAATAQARAVEQPETLPSLMAMATGLPPSRHGVTFNDEDSSKEYPGATLFSSVHAAHGRTGLYIAKSKLAMLAPRGSADVLWGAGPRKTFRERSRAPALAARFAEDFARERFALALIHFKEPDQAGHDGGWMSSRYLAAVRATDDAVAVVLAAIERSGLAPRTAVLLTSDHGGEGTSHGVGRGETSWVVPFACRLPGRAARRIDGPVTLLDVAPTVLELLGLPALPNILGKPIQPCLRSG